MPPRIRCFRPPLLRTLVVAAALTLVACSRTGLVYNNADWLLQRWASGLLAPSGTQRDAWQGHLERAMLAHRSELLPAVVALLRSAEELARDGMLAAELGCWGDALDRVYRVHAAWAVPPAVAVLSDLAPEQVEHLAGELAERNRAYRESYLDDDPAARAAARLERYLERIEHWTGRLSPQQHRLVEAHVTAMPDIAVDWLAYREDRQRRLLEMLRGGADGAALARFMNSWWAELAERPPEMVERADAVRDATTRLLLALDRSATPDQRETFLRKVAELREDLEAVSAAGGVTASAGPAVTACTRA